MINAEKLTEYTNHVIESARNKPSKLVEAYTPNSKSKSIHQKLLDVYIEESNKETHCKRLKCTSRLLEKLVRKEHLNTLIVNLYPRNEGYSLMLRGRQGADSETIRMPYEESELLEYLDAEELPPILVDLLDKSQANIFYSGCVIAEVRDYRRATNGTCDTRYVLLKPTPHSLLCDLNSLTNDGHCWTQEDKYALESQLLLATQEPLCLSPSPAVSLIINRLQYEKQKLNSPALKRSVKKFSQTAVNRKRKLAQCRAPPHLKLHDFVEKKRDKQKVVNLKCVDMWRQKEPQLTMPENLEVDQYTKILEKPKSTFDNTPVTVDEYTLETDKTQGKVHYTKLTIQQRLSDDFFIGHLYVDRDYTEGVMNGATCSFPLGTKSNVEKYVKQFTEISTKEGRPQVKITHTQPGHDPSVTFTQNLPPSTSSSTTTSQSSPGTPGSVSQASSVTTQASSQPLESPTSHKPPMKLSLSLGHSGSLSGGTSMSLQGQTTPSKKSSSGSSKSHTSSSTSGSTPTHGHKSKSQSRPPSAPNPATTPTGIAPQLPSYSQATGLLSPSGQKTPDSTPPPSSRTPTSSSGSRRSSLVESSSAAVQLTLMSQNIQQGNGLGGFMQPGQLQSHSAPATPNNSMPSGLLSVTDVLVNTTSTSTTASSSSSSLAPSPSVIAPNINIANLPPNINIQNFPNLPGMGLANIQGLQNLQNMQVSLGAVTVAGGIAVPVPITMINTAPSTSGTPVISTPSILVGSMPSVHGVPSVSGSGTTTSTTSQKGSKSATPTTLGSTQPTFVTMVTAIPPSTSTPTSSTSTTSAVTTGLVATPSTVFSTGAPPGMLQLPISMAGNLTQLMGIKGAGNLRPGAPLSFVQIPGQQPIQLLSTNLPRAPLAGQTVQLQTSTPSSGKQSNQGSQSPVSTASGSSISSSTPITAQQLVQLSPQQVLQQQQLARYHQHQMVQLQRQSSSSSRSKSKKHSKS